MTEEELAEVKALESAATPGPWEPGDVWDWAGVMPQKFGPGRCAVCARAGEPVWVGNTDINGRRMLAHKHRVSDPYGTDHLISGPDGLVAGPWGYESGGVLLERDIAFICGARTAVPALLEVIERLRDMVIDAQTEAEMQAAEVERLRAENAVLTHGLKVAVRAMK